LLLELMCGPGPCAEEDCVELTERESSICRTICDAPQPISFGELKASTSLHQEVLSRAVRRLIIHGLIRKETDGRYKGECSQ
jgi:DNA-binding HxlR family transcriptional regulator